MVACNPKECRAFLALVLGTLLVATPAGAQAVELEASGIDQPRFESDPSSDPEVRRIRGPIAGLLLIPESTNDRVMAFDPATGDLIDADYIPADSVNLATPINAIPNAAGDGFLVSDQLGDVVQEYDLDGNFVGTFAPIGGPDTAILDNIRGITLRPNGNLLVTVAGGGNIDSVAEFDTAGNYLGNFITTGAGGLDSPFDVFLRSDDYLVAGIDSDTLHSYDLSGTPQPDFAPIDTFPEQIAEAANGNVLVANFSGTQAGVVEFDTAGLVVGIYDPAGLGGFRGVHELSNGNILATNGGGVHEIDRTGSLVETKISGVSARFIEFIQSDGMIFSDGFESEDTSMWSTTTP